MSDLTGTTGEVGTTRRTALRSLAAVGAGGLVAAIVGGATAEATVGAMQFGTANNAVNAKTSLTANVGDAVFEAANSGTGGQSIGVTGKTTGSGTGVIGYVSTPTSSAWGVLGQIDGTAGIAVLALGGHAQLGLGGTVANPTTGVLVAHGVGEVVLDTTGNMWACVASGTPGSWRKLAAVSTAGALHPITPARVFDSRRPMSSQILTGDNWTISAANRIDPVTGAVVEPNIVPAGATAIAYNLTIVSTVGTNGYLAVNEGGNTVVTASSINWYANGQTAANGSVVKLNGSRQVTVICGGTSTSTHFIIDLVGYYR